MTDRGFFSLESVLDSPSIKEINKLSPFAIQLANRWMKESPQKARELLAKGELVTTLKQRAEAEALSEWRQRVRMVRSMPIGKVATGQKKDSESPAP